MGKELNFIILYKETNWEYEWLFQFQLFFGIDMLILGAKLEYVFLFPMLIERTKQRI